MNTRHLSESAFEASDPDDSSFEIVSAMLDAEPSPAAERARSLIGTVVSGRYQVRELIAMGGMGAVYRGEHIHLRKRLAVKVLHPEIENLPELVERFRREALVGAHARHPHVAAATDFGTLDDGSYFLVLEHVRGVTLHEIVRRGPLPPARAVHVARQLASALDSLHGRGIMHRDVKPHNVMIVNPSGGETAEAEELAPDDTVGPDFVKLIDFGLATVELDRLTSIEISVEPEPDSSPPERLTGSGAIFGTIAYLAPEAALGMDAVDARGDLYALGVVIYEMLTGRRPFTGDTPAEVIAQHISAPPPPFAEVVPEIYIPASLERITRRLLAKDPADRFQRGSDVVAALAAALAEINARVSHDTPATLRKIPTRGAWPLPDPDSAPADSLPFPSASAPPPLASAPPRSQVSAPPLLPPVSAPRLPMPTPPPWGAVLAPPATKSGPSALSFPKAAEVLDLTPPSHPTLGVESNEFDVSGLEAPGRTTLAMMPIAPDELGSEPPDLPTLAMLPVAPDELGPEPSVSSTVVLGPGVSDPFELTPPSLPTPAIEPSLALPALPALPALRGPPALDTIGTPPPSASSYDVSAHAPEAAVDAPRKGLPSPSPLAYVAALLLPMLAAALYLVFARSSTPPAPEATAPEASTETTAATLPKAPPPADVAPIVVAPSAAPAPSARPQASSPDGPPEAERLREKVRASTKSYDYESGRKALVALATLNPSSLSRPDLRRHSAEVVTGAEEMSKYGADELFAALTSAQAAPHGLDLLYDVVQLHGGRKAARRALALLRRPDVIARASPALRVTFAFREADCPRKEGLAERAATEGDARTLALIKTSLGGCGSSPALEKAERDLSLAAAPR